MEHTRAPPDLGRKSPGTVPAPALRGVSWRKGAAASSSPTGRGSGSPADLFPDGHGFGSPADLFPGRRGSRSVASLFPIGDGNSAASGFTSHGGVGTSSSTRGIPFPASSSPACWDSTGASPMSPPFRHSGSLDPTWENNSHPPGGFMGILNSQANLQFVGAASHYGPFKAPRSVSMDASSPPDVEILTNKQAAIVDGDNENVRTEKRIMWTAKEDERLMSAWIEHSTDSATGADRKGEAYWGDVIKAYNKETPLQRKRKAKQAKDRWHKINKWCDLFESDYVKARRVFTSGYSDQMWMDAADEFYLDHKLGPFVIKNVWKICREVAKWKTYNEELKNARKRKSYHIEEDMENVESGDEMPKRPIGQKKAKEAALAAKGKTKAMGDDGKSKESAIDVEKLDKLSKIQEEANANRMKVLELQQKLSSDKIETTKLAHLTAQENRESRKLEMEGRRLEMESKKLEMEGKKLEKESKMMDAYNNLISQDTSSMTDDEKSERVATMKCLRKMLFPEVI